MLRTSALIIALLALNACGSSQPPADSGKTATPAPAARQKTVIDDQLKAIDKAKGVEQQLQQEKERQDQQIEKQETGD